MSFSFVQPEAVCAFFPLWSEEVKFRRTCITIITTTEEGEEQRSGLRSEVSYGMSFTVQTRNQAQTSYLRRRLNKYVNKVWHVPVWMYNMELTSQAAAGSNTLNVNSTLSRELDKIGASGEYVNVLLVQDYNTFESGEVLSYTDTELTLNKNLDSTWKSGAKVYPLIRATMGMVVDLTAPTPEHSMVNLSFSESFRSFSGEV